MLKKIEGKFPVSYLDVNIEEILSRIGVSPNKFKSICDQFTNKKIFKCNNNNDLVKDSDGNLILQETKWKILE